MRSLVVVLGCITAAAILTSCGQSQTAASKPLPAAHPVPTPATPPTAAQAAEPPASPLAIPAHDAAKPQDYPGLHNVVTYSTGVFTGSVPEGPEGLETLHAMGVKTIISVDGAEPEVAKAKALGMKYVHLPIGYNGMDQQRTLELARAVQIAQQENPAAPVYMHCHHGKHRSAGALGASAVTLGFITPEQGVERMKVSGTAANYTGLYKCVQIAAPATQAQLAALPSTFPEVWKTTNLVHAMVEMDEVFEHLKAIEKAGWKAPKDHPDLVPAAEAGRLADLFRNLRDDTTVQKKPAEFTDWLLADSRKAEALESELANSSGTPESLSKHMKLLAASCKECHVKYRD